MQERPDVTLPAGAVVPVRPPDGYDRMRETPAWPLPDYPAAR